MFKRINLNNVVIFLAAVILLTIGQLSFADGDSFTINIPNSQGGYTAVVIQQSGSGYVGPQGEYYPQFPSVAQLQMMYGAGSSNVTTSTDMDNNQSSSTVEVTVEPPALPDYDLPDAPGPDYIWTPGYWAYASSSQDYYWVPGTWVTAPTPGYLWTPGYWYWRDGHYIFSEGYWGPHVGFYGGICYGYGYEGRGYLRGDHHRRGDNATSYNGGPRGSKDRPTHEEQMAMKERHVPFTIEQRRHVQDARKDPALRASANHGRPAIAATARPGVFRGNGVVTARPTFSNKVQSPRPMNERSVVLKPAEKNPVIKKPIVKPVPKIPPHIDDSSKNKNAQGSN